MTNNQLEILLTLRDKATAQLKKFQSFTKESIDAMKKYWLILAAAITATVLVIKKIGTELINVNAKVETLKTRLVILTGSVKAGNKVFADMLELAGNVPKTYEEIMEAATDLTAVVKDASKELELLMPIIVDISAATDIGVREVTSNIIRMYSAGAASADMFRDRGVLAALGFKAKVSYTHQETMDILLKQWKDGTGKYVDAAVALASTWKGLVSMMQDVWFNFKQQTGEPLFEEAKLSLRTVLAIIKDSKKEGGEYKKVVEELGKGFVDMFNNTMKFMGSVIVAGGQMVDTWTEVQLRVEGAYGALLLWLQWSGKQAQAADDSFLGKFWGSKEERAQLDQDMALFEAELARVAQNVVDLKAKSDEDYSTKLKQRISEWTELYNTFKNNIIAKDKEIADTHEELNKDKAASDAKYLKKVQDLWDKNTKTHMAGLLALGSATASVMGELAIMTGQIWLSQAKIVVETIVSVMKVIIAAVNTTLGPLGWLKAALEVTAIVLAAANAFSQIDSQQKALDAIKTQVATPVMQVPALAAGGIVTRPTLVLAGEAGPEAIVPLGKNAAMEIGDINIYITGGINPEGNSINETAEQLGFAFENRIRTAREI